MKELKDDGVKMAPLTLYPNYYLIPCTPITPNEEGAIRMNKYLDAVWNTQYNRIVRVDSGGFARRQRFPCYDVRLIKSCLELTVLDIDGMARIQFRTGFASANKDDNISGKQSFQVFIGLCNKLDVKLYDYAIPRAEGLKEKDQIEKPTIRMERSSYCDAVWYPAHHLDLNSSHVVGICRVAPGLQPVIEKMYYERNKKPIYKHVLTHVWGYMQSAGCAYQFAHLSRAGMAWTNARVAEMADRLRNTGHTIIAYNTDGIWYTGDVYHDQEEGNKFGGWKNNVVHVKLRYKSPGCYEYQDILTGAYTPVVRGATRLDRIKPREQWIWGDIYKLGDYDEETLIFEYEEGKGILDREGKKYGESISSTV